LSLENAYIDPQYIYAEKDLAAWDSKYQQSPKTQEGYVHWTRTITTPRGILTEKGAYNQFTGWITEHIIKNERDFELWNEYVPMPERVDWGPVLEAKKRIGDGGIVRSGFFDFGQGSPWQSFAYMHGTEEGILAAFDHPQWLHHVLGSMLEKKLKVIDRAGKIELDLVETGGGAGSSTVISPAFAREFCLPYDTRQHDALRAAGAKIVYHLCGGLMPMLDIVAENGADGLETMTPPGMGGDCDLVEAAKKVGDKLFFIGGFDQNRGFENGDPATVREMVYALHSACPNGGYICSPSDHFFTGNAENIQAFAKAARECVY
jgi:hypothetical protein